MSNNQNELNDIMEVLVENAGYLTEYDREIPEGEEAVIRSSAWSHIPVLLTEDENTKRWMQNNQAPILDNQNLEKQLFEMKRGSSQNPSERHHSVIRSESGDATDYHYMYRDISDEMSAMSMNQQPIYEDNEATTRSSSPESDESSVSDWCPGPSSIETSTKSNSPSAFEPETDSRRLSKRQKETMTDEQLEKRRREANKKNSKNYNKNKKAKEQELMKELEETRVSNSQKKESNLSMRRMLHECYTFTGSVIRISDEEVMRTFISKNAFEEELRAIDSRAQRIKLTDAKLKTLSEACEKRRKVYDKADKDIHQKRININTYGSRKSRALHSMNIAELQFKLAELQLSKQKLQEKEDYMNVVKNQMSSIFNFRYVGAEYLSLPTDRKSHFDYLCRVLKADSPNSSLRRPS
ncbi:unnamed protein product [Caenorhabditis brenneri]